MFTNNKRIIRWLIIVISFAIVSLILWNTYVFFQRFSDEEKTKMEILALAYKKLNAAGPNDNITLETKILETNASIPMIVTDNSGTIIMDKNLDERKKKNNENYLEDQLALIKAQNPPLIVQSQNVKHLIYYKDSEVLTNLKYYPLALLLILVLFFALLFLYSKSNRIAAQNQLWTGMAKETAHQIGTPLSSLMGWTTILRENDSQAGIADEIEKDVNRLNTIANRFSQIGSTTALIKDNIVEVTQDVLAYMESRSSQQIDFNFFSEKEEIVVKLNRELYGWVIENVIKNAIDAMEGKGKLKIEILDKNQDTIICVYDTGKGLAKNKFKQIFEPGYTTKKRGWGIGLSLSKRIIESFHHGKIFVKESEVGNGTTICIRLPKV